MSHEQIRTFIQNDLVSKDFNLDGAPRHVDNPCDDLSHGFRASLDIHSAYPDDDGFSPGALHCAWDI